MTTPAASSLPPSLPVPTSLRAALLAAGQRQEPLVVMVTLKGCAFCDVVRNNYLGPMHRKGEIQVAQIDMLDRKTTLQSPEGTTTTPHEQAKAWKVRIAPTLLFLNPHGQEVAERLEGIAVADFYGAYLDQRLETARLQTQLP